MTHSSSRQTAGLKLSHAMRSISIVAVLVIAFVIFAVIVLWDAPHRDARIRVEQIKNAWFGDWVTGDDLNPTKENEAVTNQLADRLRQAKDISFFEQERWFGPNKILLITTGKKFATVNDFLNGRFKEQWCYTGVQTSGATIKVDLAKKVGLQPTHFADLKKISLETVNQMQVKPEALASIARSHCRISDGSEMHHNGGSDD